MKPKLLNSFGSKAYLRLSTARLCLYIYAMVAISACTIEQKKQFEQVQVGMDKGQVLDIMDSPQKTERHHGQDRWIYYIENSDATNPVQHDQKVEKQIYFENGKSTYVGDPIKPLISAEEQDRINEEQNIAIQNAEAASRKKQKSESRSTQSVSESTDKSSDKSANESTTADSKTIYLPQYAPVQ